MCVAELERTSLAQRYSNANCFYRAVTAKQNMAAGLIRPAGPWFVTLGQSLSQVGPEGSWYTQNGNQRACLSRPPARVHGFGHITDGCTEKP